MTRSMYREVAAWLLPTALATDHGATLVATVLEELRARRIVCLPLPAIERLGGSVLFLVAIPTSPPPLFVILPTPSLIFLLPMPAAPRIVAFAPFLVFSVLSSALCIGIA